MIPPEPEASLAIVCCGPVVVEENRGLMDLEWRERALILALIIPILGLGLYPNPALRRIEPSVLEVSRQIAQRQSPGGPVVTGSELLQREVR